MLFPRSTLALGAEVDIASNDNYSDPREPNAARHAAFGRDLMRSLKRGRPWILMGTGRERGQLASEQRAQVARTDERLERAGCGARRGRDPVLSWRQSVAGSEKFHSAMLPHAGADTPIFHEISAYGARCSTRTPAATAPAKREAPARLGEPLGELDQRDHPATFSYERVLRDWYEAAHRAHVQLDFADPSDDLSAYALASRPPSICSQVVERRNISRYVADGGALVTTSFTDIVDENDRFAPAGSTRPRGGVRGSADRLLGRRRRREREILRQGESIGKARSLREELRLDGAVVTAGFEDGAPAIVEHLFGKGSSIHIAANSILRRSTRSFAALSHSPTSVPSYPGCL